MTQSFNVASSSIIVTDPCYELPISMRHELQKIVDVKNGKWFFEAEVSDEGAWGNRVQSLTVYHEDHKAIMGGIEVSNYIAVDSGQAGFFDLGYFTDHVSEREYGETGFYKTCCDATHDEKDPDADQFGVVDGQGVVSSSGFGDGQYTLTGGQVDGVYVRLSLSFFGDEDEDESEEDHDYYEEDYDDAEAEYHDR